MIYTVCAQRDTWLSREIHLLLSLRTPQASIPRDMGVEFIISQHRLLLKVTHPQKNILIQGLCHRKPFIDILHFRIQWIVKPELFFIINLSQDSWIMLRTHILQNLSF